MDYEYQSQLEEQLKTARRLLHGDKMIRARAGMYCDPAVLIRIEDREEEIAQIESRLGIRQPEPTPRRREYSTPVRARYAPAADLERQRGDDAAHHVKLLGIHRGNLAHYTRQARAHGGVDFAPPIVSHGIAEARTGIAHEKRVLRAAGVRVEDFAEE